MTADFDRLLDILMPSKKGIVTMLEAYFDESGREGGIFCVADYAFVKPQAKKFAKERTALFGDKGCRMSELHIRKKRFEGINSKEGERLIKSAVAIISRRISFGVVVSCAVPEITQLLPRFVVGGKGYVIDGMQDPYPVCCHVAMSYLGRLANLSDSIDGIAYFFESGHEFASAAHRFMALTDSSPPLKALYAHRSHAFVPKTQAVQLQSADILAWEWARFVDISVIQDRRRMRPSLKALIAPDGVFDSRRYAGTHLTGAPLENFMRQAAQLGILQVQEDNATKAPR